MTTLHRSFEDTVVLLPNAIIVFTDIVRSTPLVEAIGDVAYAKVLTLHNIVVRDQIARHGGCEIHQHGDGFIALFNDATQAGQCARGIQQRTGARAPSSLCRNLFVRIGVHVGDVLRIDGDQLIGRNLHYAERVAGLAGAGEILASFQACFHLEKTGDLELGEVHHVELRGFHGWHAIRPILQPVKERNHEIDDLAGAQLWQTTSQNLNPTRWE